jgi:Tfp pilus assembly protein PilO
MKQMWLFTALVVVASLALGYFFLVSPKKAKVDELHATAQKQRVANTELDSDITRLEEQQKTLPSKQLRLAEISLNIPKTPMLPTLTRALTKLSSATGVAIQKIEPKKPVFAESDRKAAAPEPEPSADAADKDAKSATAAKRKAATTPTRATAGELALVEVQIQAWGSFAEIQEFLLETEQLKRLMVVTNIKIVRAPPEDPDALARPGSASDLELVLTARVFMRKTADQRVLTAPGAAATPAPKSGAK